MIRVILSILFIIFSSNLKSENLKNLDISLKSDLLNPYEINFVVSNYNKNTNIKLYILYIKTPNSNKINLVSLHMNN